MKRIKKLATVNSVVAVLLLVTFALSSFERFHEAVVADTSDNLEKCLHTFRILLQTKGDGFRIVEGKLLAGSYVINGNFEVPDKIQEIFGGTSTVFMGDLRVATNVLREDGTRAVGTRLEGPAYDAIFGEGKAFRGETLILGTPYLTAYDPIRDKSGKIIGALYVGRKKSEFLEHYSALQTKLGLILFGWLSVYITYLILVERLTKKAEQQKEHDLGFLQTVIDTIPNPVYYKDIEGRYLGGNKAFAEFAGVGVAQLIGKTYREITTPTQEEICRRADQELFSAPGVQSYESSLYYADGVRHDVIFYKASFPGADGSPAGLIGTMLDITERKRAENELRESRQYLSDIIEFCPDAIIVIDQERKVATWNRAMEKLSGVPASEMLGRGNYEYALPFYGECRPILIDLVLRHAEDVEARYINIEHRGNILVGESYIHNARGEQIYFHGTAAALYNSSGEIIGAIESIRDVTARKAAEEELELKNVILTTQQECSIDGILVVDEGGTIISHNRRFIEMWGIPPELMRGCRYGPVVRFMATRPVAPEDYLIQSRHLHQNRDEKVHEEIVLKDGMVFDCYSAPMMGANGKYCGRVWYFRDVTDLQRARQESLRAQKLESLGVLAGGIAHDFNNILTAILGNISLSRYQVHDADKVLQRLDAAEQALVRAKDLTQQLLTFARGGEPVKRVVEVESLLRESAGFAIHGCSVECLFAIEDDLWPVHADEGQISQVIHNLVLNAIQAMPNGGSITIAAHNSDTPDVAGRSVFISVKDTGAGIPERLLEKIFDPYFTTKQQGSGLGLATCYSIIRKHRGSIAVTSVPNQGTTFEISLPAAKLGQKGAPPAVLEAAKGRGRILVMDDEAMIRQIVKDSLEALGYLVECAEDGRSAVEIYRKFQIEGSPFAAVIMDLTIPGGIGGKEAIHSLMEIDPQVKAIVSSGYATDPVMANYRDFGFSAVLSKPYRLQEVGKVLRDLLL